LKRNRATLEAWFSGLADFAIVPSALRAFIRSRRFVRLRIASGSDGENIIGAKLLRIRFTARSATTRTHP
jgi:hypothetical protein